jgi:23S rRNA (uracil1939-C5)-methyltransferase
MVADTLAPLGIPASQIADVLPSPDIYFCRNKMEFAFGVGEDGLPILGLHPRGRYNSVFDLEACHLQSGVSNQTVRIVRAFAREQGWSVYHLKRHKGLLRFLTIREGKRTGDVMVNLIVSEEYVEGFDRLTDRLFASIPNLKSVMLSVHPGRAQVAAGEPVVIRGASSIREEIFGLTFDISPYAFFQTNTRQAERLYHLILDLAKLRGDEEVLDLYCGTGTITMILARHAKRVIGVEIVEEAIADARRNAERNDLQNITFYAGDVADVVSSLLVDGYRPDLIVTDPPRSGMGKKGMAIMLTATPLRIIYVSCNPVALASDLNLLLTSGYTIRSIQPVDMFPHTPHCEVVVEVEKS